MNINDIEKEHPSYGFVSVNRFMGGRDELFGQRKVDNGGITLRFEQADLNNSFGDITKFSHNRLLTELNMTSEQWSSLLLNKDTEHGTPVTIVYGLEGRSSDVNELECDKSDQNSLVFDKFKSKIVDKFKENKLLEREVISILNQDKIPASDRRKIMENFLEISKKIITEKEFFEEEVVEFISNVENTFEQKFVNDLKRNLLGIDDTKLLENKDNESIEKDYMGVLVLRTIDNVKGTLVKDFEADNGYSLTLYKAKMFKDGNKPSIERSDEVIIEVRLSHSQFSSFITNFGGRDNPCSISMLDNTNIEPCRVNINDEVEDVFKLYEFIDKIESEIDSLTDELEPLVSKAISKTNKRNVSFVFEKLARLTGSNLFFYSKNVFNSGLKFSLRRQEDVQAGIFGDIHKEAMKKIANVNKIPQHLLK